MTLPPLPKASLIMPLRLFRLLDKAEKRQAIVLLGIMAFGSLVDVLGLASLMPLVGYVTNPDGVISIPTLGRLFKPLLQTDYQTTVLYLLGVTLTLFVSKHAVGFISTRLQAKFAFGLSQRLSLHQLNAYLNKDILFHRSNHSTQLLRNTLNVPHEFAQQVVLSALLVLSEGMVVLLVMGLLWAANPRVMLLVGGTLAPMFWLLFTLTKRRVGKLGRERSELWPQSTQKVGEALAHHTELQVGGRTELFLREVDTLQGRLRVVNARLFSYNQLPPRLIEFTVVCGVLLLLGYVVFFRQEERGIMNILALFAAAAFRLMPSVNRIVSSAIKMRDYGFTVLVAEAAAAAPVRDYVPGRSTLAFARTVTLENVTFSYPDRQKLVFEGIDLTVRRGAHVGVCGPSGSGKSTLAYLLMGLLTPNTGTLAVDGEPLLGEGAPRDSNSLEAELAAYRQGIAYVRQDVALLDSTIQRNITMGLEPTNAAMERRLAHAVEAAGLTRWLESLPSGLSTRIGEGGALISGGQRQRLAIARALYQDTPLVVLDEATANLDAETEGRVLDALEALRHEGRTLVSISHREAVLARCTEVFALEGGKLRPRLDLGVFAVR